VPPAVRLHIDPDVALSAAAYSGMALLPVESFTVYSKRLGTGPTVVT
jgi:hypothetical protein